MAVISIGDVTRCSTEKVHILPPSSGCSSELSKKQILHVILLSCLRVLASELKHGDELRSSLRSLTVS
jgi:hypothetical protein